MMMVVVVVQSLNIPISLLMGDEDSHRLVRLTLFNANKKRLSIQLHFGTNVVDTKSMEELRRLFEELKNSVMDKSIRWAKEKLSLCRRRRD
jgi:hypothetical protein